MENMPNYDEYLKVVNELHDGVPLNLCHLGRIFGQPFWVLITIALCDAREARSILDELIKTVNRENIPTRSRGVPVMLDSEVLVRAGEARQEIDFKFPDRPEGTD